MMRSVLRTFVALTGSICLYCCNSTNEAPCDNSACPTDNTCIEWEGKTECRLTCSTQRGGTGCPHNYTCVGDGFCVADKTPVEKKAGQWGASCNAAVGQDDAACDLDQSFGCSFSRPNDPYAFCTRFGCETDADCTGGYYCGTANYVTPNGAHTLGDVDKLCLPRGYCAPCNTDLDCGPGSDGGPQRCMLGDDGAGFCTGLCNNDNNCATDASCEAIDDETSVCVPYARTCVGNGQLCSPCRSDADCKGGGACTGTAYFSEKWCSAPAPDGACGEENKCPKELPAGSKAVGVGCVSESFDGIPANHCIGVIELGRGKNKVQMPGCFSRNR